jgi:N,N'-diacetyllegionaminate synthase
MTSLRIADHIIGESGSVFVIAEIGSNHDGSLARAKELIAASADAGADAVKVQSFSAEDLLNRKTLERGMWVEDPAYKGLSRLELPVEWHKELRDHANSLGIVFMSTPFDESRAELLNDIEIKAFKIASGDITHIGLIKKVAGFMRPIILSTGAAFLEEIEDAIAAIRAEGNNKIILLHCVSNYPPRFEDCNVRAITALKKSFSLPVGISDHSPGMTVPLAAVALGACVVEKHVTFDRSLPGPDHSYALTFNELAETVKEIRNLEKALGKETKMPSETEMPEREGARRSIYARTDIKKGDFFSTENLKIVRHHFGIAPKHVELIIGQRAKKDIKQDDLIEKDAL